MLSKLQETKSIDTRAKGIRDDDQDGFMGAEDKRGKHTIKNNPPRLGSEANARATMVQQPQQETAAAGRKLNKQQNLIEYRRKIYQAFEDAQSSYMERKREANAGHLRVDPLDQVITSKNEVDFFQTVRPLAHKFMDDKKPFHKFGSKLGGVKTRYFVLDDDSFIYYADKNATVAKKSLSLGSAAVVIENKDEVKPKKLKKWTSKNAQNRVAITLANQGAKKKYYVYSDDLNLLKSLMVKVKVAANPTLKEMLSNEVQKMSLIHRTCQFDQFWTYLKLIYEQREKRLVSFQLLGLHFVDIAAQNWQRNRKILKSVTSMADSLSEKGSLRNKRRITKREQKLQSSFRKGRAKATTERDMSINVSLMLHHRMQQLVNMIRTRKYRRSAGVQDEITKLYRQEVVGYRGPLVAFNKYDLNGKNISRQMLIDGDGRICFEPQNPGLMLFENLRPEKFQDLDFFENDYLTRLDLNEVSLISTDQPGFYIDENDDEEAEYSIKIYGPVTKQAYLSKDKINQTTEFAGLAPLRKVPQEMFTVNITSLKFPVAWAHKNNGKGFIRVRLTQALGKDLEKDANDKDFEMDPQKQFTYLSFDVRLEFTDKQLREADEEVELKLNGLQFFLTPIYDRNKERFVVEVLFYANICPVPTVVKDFMIENVWEADKKEDGVQLLQQDQRMTVDVSDSLGQFVAIDMTVKYKLQPTPEEAARLDQMEGPRLLVGRYCLMDEHRTMQVMQYNSNDTVKLRSVQTGEAVQGGKDISLSRVKKIERYGVSVYDASKLPEQISKSHFAWTCQIKTKDRSLLQTLLTKISQANCEKTMKKRKPTFERKSGIASGKVIITIVEAKNLRQSEAVKSLPDNVHFSPYVKVSIEVLEPGLKPRQLGKAFATNIAKPENMKPESFKELLKVSSWRTIEDPTGQTIELGEFQKNMKSKEAVEKRSSLIMTLEAMQQLSGQLANAKELPDKTDPEHIFLKFQVFQRSPGAEPILLGSSLLKATRVIDLDKIWSSQQMLLLLPKEGVQEPSHNAILQKKEHKKVEKKQSNTTETESSEEDLDAPYGADPSQLLPHAEFQDPTNKHTLAGTLQINTLFIPDTETRHQFSLYDDYSIFKIPESRIHYGTLMSARMFDNYHYAVPMNFYDPRDHTVERYVDTIDVNGRPRVLKSHDEMDLYQQQLKQEFMQERNLPEAKRLIRQQHSINIAIQKKIFSCPEEITDFYLWLKNHNRPMRQQYTSDFTKMWLAHCLQISYDARKKINRFLWQQYLADLIGSGEVVAFDEEELKKQASQNNTSNTSKRRTTFVTGSIEALHQQTRIRANNPSYAHQHSLTAPSKANETAYSLIMHNKRNNILMFSGIWEKQQDQKYADLHYLIHAGIPDELRPTIWKELLKAEIVEVEEIQNFKDAYGSQFPYDKTKTLFSNYTHISDKSDCLAFKQIDEDVGKFHFGNSYQDNSQNPDEKDLIQRTEKYQMRSLLRVLILWSKQRKLSGADVCITYGDGFMRIIQRMITITHSEEDCFWILTGIIRSFPRPFAVTGSVLNSDCDSVMRYEMTAFKAMLQQNLPAVHEKLKDYGLPVEFLVYKSMMSFYADYFTSEVVLRLWDIIIFNFSSSDKAERKRGLWWLLSPAYYVLREKQRNILKAKSCTEIIQEYQSGGALTYDPDYFVSEIREINKKIFVEGEVKTQQKGFVSGFFGKRGGAAVLESVENRNAYDFEEQRRQYQEQLKAIFEITQVENATVSELIDQGNRGKNREQEANVVNYKALNEDFMEKIKIISLEDEKRPDEEDKLNGQQRVDVENLPVKGIHVYLHGLTQVPVRLPQGFSVKLTYGQINPDTYLYVEDQLGQQNKLHQQAHKQMQEADKVRKIDTHSHFKYKNSYNHIRIELMDVSTNSTVADAFITLSELPLDRFISRKFLLRNPKILDNVQSYLFSFTHIQVSFYLDSNRDSIENQNQLFKSLLTIQKKMPDRIDIFNQTNQEDLSNHFESLVRQEEIDLGKFLDMNAVLDIINETYNYVESGNYGNLTMDQFLALAKEILPSTLTNPQSLRRIFAVFTGATNIPQIEENKQELSTSTLLDPKTSTMLDPKKLQEMQSQRKSTMRKSKFSVGKGAAIDVKVSGKNEQGGEMVFSLRSFITTLVLMSHCTVEEKVGLLFDMYDWVDGSADGNKPNQIFELVQTIFERNLYFWPTHELYNMLEKVFTGSVAMVYSAFWTKDLRSLHEKRVNKQCKLSQVLSAPNKIDYNQEGSSIEVTKEVQAALTNYFSIFGTKMIDFNPDVSAFKNLGDLIGQENAEQLIKATAGQSSEQSKYKLVLFCTADSERFNFEVNYDNYTGNLLSTGNADIVNRVSDITTYFKRNSNRAFLIGMTRPITKDEFLSKMELIPLFTNLIRVETFYRDRKESTLRQKKRIRLPVFVTFSVSNLLFTFKFESRNIPVIEGRDIQPRVSQRAVTFDMNELHEEDILSDVRDRIATALLTAQTQFKKWTESLVGTDVVLSDVIGSRNFFVLSSENKEQQMGMMHWNLISSDYCRFQQFGESVRGEGTILLKLDSSREQRIQESVELRDDASVFDCLSLYKHPDQSYEWRKCRIVRRELKPNYDQVKNATFDSQSFVYWIEFLHLCGKGSQMWFKRNSEEILFGGVYTREIQRSFRQEVRDYIRETYKFVGQRN